MSNPPEEEQGLIPVAGPAADEEDYDANEMFENNNENARGFLQIQDEAAWLQRYGISGEPHYGDESYANQLEAKKRVQDQFDYQEKMHEQIFKEAREKDDEKRLFKQSKLDRWAKETICLVSAQNQNQSIECNLKLLASHSDTVFAMALSRHHYNNNAVNKNGSNNSQTEEAENKLSLSLEEYPKGAVEAFLKLLLDNETTTITQDSIVLNPDWIVDCCRIAHYLQCTQMLDSIVQILKASIDSANCMSICQLADQLALSDLLETSMNHVIQSLGSLEDHEIWSDLSPDLQNRIQTIKSVLQSSNRRQIFFSSFTEYLAMFAEQVDYYRERLVEAQIQQDQHSKESRAWEYAQEKIDRQTERVQILKKVFAEQKKCFGKKTDFI